MPLTRKNILIRFGMVYFFIVLLFLLIVYKIVVIQVVEKRKWMELADRVLIAREDVVEPNRGNIFSTDGRLMASTIPYYYIIMDMRVPNFQQNDAFMNNVDSLALCMSKKFGDRTVAEYRNYLVRGFMSQEGRLFLYPERISHSDLLEVKKFPILRWGGVKGGLIVEERLRREKPFGSLASRTIGDIYGERTKSGKYGRYGLEMSFDSLLQGKPGVASVQRVGNKRLKINKVDPIEGFDLTTTIDIDMQDIAEKSLLDMLRKIDAEKGCAILMDVKTGEVKVCVNLSRIAEGEYREVENMAVGDMSEPGSTFKTMSLIVALEDGVVDVSDTVNTHDGVYKFHGVEMRDHNYLHGGYGKISVADALAYSSNIGVSRVIMEHYEKNPEKFVGRLYDMCLNKPMNLELPGSGKPYIRHPKDLAQKWSPIDLAWMSIGYVIQIPPIYTLALYNAIANDGCYIRPYFVKNVMKNGQILDTYETEVMNPRLCSKQVLGKIRKMLEGTVEYGTGSPVKSEYVKIAGKTGTAQLHYKKGSGGRISHQVSFCGYFPADNPQYTGIVVIREPRLGYPSGGTMSGGVFKNMAEQIYAQKVSITPEDFSAKESIEPHLPSVKNGQYESLKRILSDMDVDYMGETPEHGWVKTTLSEDAVQIKPLEIKGSFVPNVGGMGAKDAVYLMEKVGVRTRIAGSGKVVKQSIEPGTAVLRGMTVYLELR